MTIIPPDPDLDALRLERASAVRARLDLRRTRRPQRDFTPHPHRIEQGRSTGSLKTWHALTHAMGASFDQLLGAMCVDHDPPGTGTV